MEVQFFNAPGTTATLTNTYYLNTNAAVTASIVQNPPGTGPVFSIAGITIYRLIHGGGGGGGGGTKQQIALFDPNDPPGTRSLQWAERARSDGKTPLLTFAGEVVEIAVSASPPSQDVAGQPIAQGFNHWEGTLNVNGIPGGTPPEPLLCDACLATSSLYWNFTQSPYFFKIARGTQQLVDYQATLILGPTDLGLYPLSFTITQSGAFLDTGFTTISNQPMLFPAPPSGGPIVGKLVSVNMDVAIGAHFPPPGWPPSAPGLNGSYPLFFDESKFFDWQGGTLAIWYTM
jgi:hypothetical protein